MKPLTTTHLSTVQVQQLLLLWNKEYPEQLAYNDIAGFRSYLSGLTDPAHFLLFDEDSYIRAWAFTFTREAERWFAIILDESVQGKGVGTQLLSALKQNETCLNGWATDHDRYFKKDQTPYRSPIDFYLKNGFKLCDDVRLETEKLSAVKITWKR